MNRLVSQDIGGQSAFLHLRSKTYADAGNRFVKVVGWYDNEWLHNRCVELLQMLGK